MTVRQLKSILDILNDESEVKVLVDSYAFRDKDTFVSEAQVFDLPNADGMGVRLVMDTRPLSEENEDDK